MPCSRYHARRLLARQFLQFMDLPSVCRWSLQFFIGSLKPRCWFRVLHWWLAALVRRLKFLVSSLQLFLRQHHSSLAVCSSSLPLKFGVHDVSRCW